MQFIERKISFNPLYKLNWLRTEIVNESEMVLP